MADKKRMIPQTIFLKRSVLGIFFFVGGFCFIYSSCTIGINIYIQQNGSALVNTTEDTIGQFSIFYNSPQILNLSQNKFGITFTISNIDSLGQFLSPMINKDVFQFIYSVDSLVLRQNKGKVFKMEDYGAHLRIEITPRRKIKEIRTRNSFVKIKKDKIVISMSRRCLTNEKEHLDLVVLFTENQ